MKRPLFFNKGHIKIWVVCAMVQNFNFVSLQKHTSLKSKLAKMASPQYYIYSEISKLLTREFPNDNFGIALACNCYFKIKKFFKNWAYLFFILGETISQVQISGTCVVSSSSSVCCYASFVQGFCSKMVSLRWTTIHITKAILNLAFY